MILPTTLDYVQLNYPEYNDSLDGIPDALLQELFPDVKKFGPAAATIRKFFNDLEKLLQEFPYESPVFFGTFDDCLLSWESITNTTSYCGEVMKTTIQIIIEQWTSAHMKNWLNLRTHLDEEAGRLHRLVDTLYQASSPKTDGFKSAEPDSLVSKATRTVAGAYNILALSKLSVTFPAKALEAASTVIQDWEEYLLNPGWERTSLIELEQV